jgi:3-methyladenine DNA glycosylase AlkD
MGYQDIKKEIILNASSKYAKNLQRFFKTGKGEYGEGDIFVGIKIPVLRKIAQKYIESEFAALQKLLNSKIHEERMVALLILTYQYKKYPAKESEVYNFYLQNFKHINNWDLVDLSAPIISGKYLLDKDNDILYKWARSDHLWTRRIAVLSTYEFIRNSRFDEILKIAEILLNDTHDLMHKAVGWMLREVGKRDLKTEETFLRKNYKNMPRTMLRYAIERFEETKRKAYLKGEI